MVPERPAVAHLVQLRNADAVLIRRDVLGPDVHGDLGQVQVGADARRGGDAGDPENVQEHRPGQLPGRHKVRLLFPFQCGVYLLLSTTIEVLAVPTPVDYVCLLSEDFAVERFAAVGDRLPLTWFLFPALRPQVRIGGVLIHGEAVHLFLE